MLQCKKKNVHHKKHKKKKKILRYKKKRGKLYQKKKNVQKKKKKKKKKILRYKQKRGYLLKKKKKMRGICNVLRLKRFLSYITWACCLLIFVLIINWCSTENHIHKNNMTSSTGSNTIHTPGLKTPSKFY